MATQGTAQADNGAGSGIIWGVVLAFVLGFLAWAGHRQEIRYYVLLAVYWGVYPFTYISSTATKIEIAIVSHSWSFWTPSRLLDIYDAASSLYWRWPFMAIFGLVAFKAVRMSQRAKYSENLSLQRLAAMMVLENPSIAPTLRLDAHKQPLDGGMLQTPRTPLQFAVENQLLLDGDGQRIERAQVFRADGLIKPVAPNWKAGTHPIGGYTMPASIDMAAAERAFAAQLKGGFERYLNSPLPFDPKQDLPKLPSWAQALAAAMYAYNADMKDDSERILEHLSLAWRAPEPGREGGWQWKGFPVRWRSVDEMLAGRIDWDSTENPSQPKRVDESYITGAIPLIPWRILPVCKIRRTSKQRSFDTVWRFEWRWKGKPIQPSEKRRGMRFQSVPAVKPILSKMLSDPDFAHVSQLHGSHVCTWFMALMEWAQGGGSFTTSQFIWLRPMRPTLFYALNQMGGECAWAQAAGPWAHYRTEVMARRTIEQPAVELAIKTLVDELNRDGWLGQEEASSQV